MWLFWKFEKTVIEDGRVFVQIEWWESDDDIRDVLPTFLICWLGSELENDIIGNKLSMESRTIEYSMKERWYIDITDGRKFKLTTNLKLSVTKHLIRPTLAGYDLFMRLSEV